MKPFHLVIENNIQATDVGVTFYGEDSTTPLGSTNCERRDDPIARFSPDLLIDLEPILKEIEAKIITSAEQLGETDDLLQLRDLLLENDFNALCTMIFNVLKQVVEKSSSRSATRSGETTEIAPAPAISGCEASKHLG